MVLSPVCQGPCELADQFLSATMLLQRIAVELFAEPLQQDFLPLTFPEEQYIEVDRLSKFWLNCLDAAADALERENNGAAVAEIDQTVRQLEQVKIIPGQPPSAS